MRRQQAQEQTTLPIRCDRLSTRSCRRIKVVLSFLAAPLKFPRRDAGQPMKTIREMGLAGEPDFQCDLANRHLSGGEQFLREFEPPCGHVAMGWEAGGRLESPAEMVRAQVCFARQFC